MAAAAASQCFLPGVPIHFSLEPWSCGKMNKRENKLGRLRVTHRHSWCGRPPARQCLFHCKGILRRGSLCVMAFSPLPGIHLSPFFFNCPCFQHQLDTKWFPESLTGDCWEHSWWFQIDCRSWNGLKSQKLRQILSIFPSCSYRTIGWNLGGWRVNPDSSHSIVVVDANCYSWIGVWFFWFIACSLWCSKICKSGIGLKQL